MSLVALEGGVCAGKSAIARCFGHSNSTQVIDDYTSFIDRYEYSYAEGLPPLYRFRFFLRLDEARRARIDYPRPKDVVLDRSIFTILAYEYALKETGRISDLSHIAHLSHFLPLLPTNVIFLGVSSAERMRRATLRSIPIAPILLDEHFNLCVERFFERLHSSWRVPIINTTGVPILDIYDRCRRHLANSQPLSLSISDLVDLFGTPEPC
jgi:thymidylate kinase